MTRRAMGRVAATVFGVAMAVSIELVATQTVITAPPNKYKPSEDVEIGKKTAVEVEKQLPVLRDDQITSTVAAVGRRLVNRIPSNVRHSEFRYSFKVINVRDINAFALPGGPMYVNRGMIESAASEGEMAGVMAHELSHVALRHGTAQATKATKYEFGGLVGQIVGQIIGGRTGAVVSQGTQIGLGTAFMRFSRADERQADLLGSHIMADAGYDPIEMANMFRTIEKEAGAGGPEWLSDHPNPGNRSEYITAEARTLSVGDPIRDTRSFAELQSRLKRMPPAPTTAEVTKKTDGK